GRLMWRIGKVVALHDETRSARTIMLEVPDWPGHAAGQHVDLRLTAQDGYSAVRSYSIASAPNSEKRIELTVERLRDRLCPAVRERNRGSDMGIDMPEALAHVGQRHACRKQVRAVGVAERVQTGTLRQFQVAEQQRDGCGDCVR